ncbi:MAG: hypothetical protein U1E25_16170 [Methylocystis sp.]
MNFHARQSGDPAAIVAANERIRRTLGWTPQNDDLDEIIGRRWSRRSS